MFLFLKNKLIFKNKLCYDLGMENKNIFKEFDDKMEKLKIYIESEKKAWERANRIWQKLKEQNYVKNEVDQNQ